VDEEAWIVKNQRQIVRSLAMVTQLGISMLAPVVLCAFFGEWLNRRFGWSAAAAVLVILGILAGARNSWIMLRQISEEDTGRKRHEKDESDTF
jgi:ATP synthase protein I